MAFVESLAPFFADFGVQAQLAGEPVVGIFDASSYVETGEGLVTQAPTFDLPTASALSTAPADVLVLGAASYTVRQVLRRPPDGALTRLVLARV